MGELVVSALRPIKPLQVTEKDFVFKNKKATDQRGQMTVSILSLSGCGVRARKFYATRHTFISDARSHGVNIKWLAEYCGTSVAMIEKHYGRYIKSDS